MKEGPTGLERRIIDHLDGIHGWASLHELRAAAGGFSDSKLHHDHGVTLTAAVASLKADGLVETRGGWEGGPLVVRLKVGS